MNWTEIFGAIIVSIIGPVVVLLTRKYIRDKDEEKKYRLTYGKEVAILAGDGKYVMADINNHNVLVAREKHIKSWEVFKLVHASFPFSSFPTRAVCYGDEVAFLATNNKNFVGAALHSDQKELTAWVAHVRGWETFTLLRPPRSESGRSRKALRYGSSFALRACNGRNVRYNRDGDGRLLADAAHVKAWETFVFIDPAHPL